MQVESEEVVLMVVVGRRRKGNALFPFHFPPSSSAPRDGTIAEGLGKGALMPQDCRS